MNLFSRFLLPHVCLLVVLELSTFASAKMAPPKPPEENPHPALTLEDKKRVAFAQKAIELLLKSPLPKNLQRTNHESPNLPFQNKDLACIQNPACYKKEVDFVNHLITFHQSLGEVVEIRHPHIIPGSMQKFLEHQAKLSESQGTSKPPLLDEQRPLDKMDAPKPHADEYIVHIYARFSKTSSLWYHVDVILTEDAERHLFLRHFFIIPIPDDRASLPPGVEC